MESNRCRSDFVLIDPESVYESASEIGEHFKQLIQLFGSEAFESILPSVVRVLENLEEMVVQRNECLLVVDQLHKQIDELQMEHRRRAEAQRKYQIEFEDIDELWRNENGKLEQYVRFLKTENKRLNALRNDSSFANNNNKNSYSLTDLLQEPTTTNDDDDDDDEENRQKNSVKETQTEKLNAKIRLLQNEIEFKSETISNLQTQIDNLSRENGNLKNVLSCSLAKILESSDEHDNKCSKLAERNDSSQLRDRIRNLEERLTFYKAQLQEAEAGPPGSDPTEQHDEDELPVQGPIPKEPEEKELNWSPQKQRSRIWSFFPRLTKALISNTK